MSQLWPVVAMALLTWVIIFGQRQKRAARRDRVSSLDAKLRELHAREDEARVTIENLAEERVRVVSQRAELLSTTMETSLELQRVLNEQRAQDRDLADAYARAHNATKLKDKLAAEVDGACQKHGQPVPAELKAARAAVLQAQSALESLADELTAARQHATAAAGRVADDALAEAAEVPPPTTVAPTTAPPVPTLGETETAAPRRRRRRRKRHLNNVTEVPSNSTVANATRALA